MSCYATDCGWNWSRFQHLVPANICSKLAAIKAPLSNDLDFPCWKLVSDGLFSIKSAYEALRVHHQEAAASADLFELIWNWTGPPRIKSFLWKLGHGRLMTNEERVKLRLGNDSECPRGCTHSENVMHLLRDCELVLPLWEEFVHQDQWAAFASKGYHDWLWWNLSSSDLGPLQIPWPIFFGVVLDALWRDRNKLVFSRSTDLESGLSHSIISQAHFIYNESVKDSSLCSPPPRKEVHVAWTPPPSAFFKVNVDGSHLPSTGSSACGGLIRDSKGKFIHGFFCNVGCGSSVVTEFLGLLLGVHLARRVCGWML